MEVINSKKSTAHNQARVVEPTLQCTLLPADAAKKMGNSSFRMIAAINTSRYQGNFEAFQKNCSTANADNKVRKTSRARGGAHNVCARICGERW
jgi:hypothetical protein